MGLKILSVPAFRWSFGCSATSGAMIAGYYDRTGLGNMYTGPTNGSVIPLNDSTWPSWIDGYGATYAQCPLTASHYGLDGRATFGSIDDYWVKYLGGFQDPYIIWGWAQHPWGEAIGDYMKTSQSAYGNDDGSTTFWGYASAQRLNCISMPVFGLTNDGTYGRKMFYEARGYTVTDCYNQKTDNLIFGGFSFAQYKAEIDAGRPVMLNLEGHTIVGVGYDDSTNMVYLHDTWDNSTHTMLWGGSYAGLGLHSVSIVNIQNFQPSPIIITGAATHVTNNSATLNGTVNPSGSATTYYFQWGTTQAYGNMTSSQSAGSGSNDVAVSANLTGLTLGPTYHFRLVASNSWGTSYGSDRAFTPTNLPRVELGIFRDGFWAIDYHGNGFWEGAPVSGLPPDPNLDFVFGPFGLATDKPVTGNWDGNSLLGARIGVFRNGMWFLDGDGNGFWNGCTQDGGTDLCLGPFGVGSDIPVIGDWAGDGRTRVGVFRNGLWFLDNGNGLWDGCGAFPAQDLCLGPFGIPGDYPVTGNWVGSAGNNTKIGIFRNGVWALDANSSGLWDAGDILVPAFGLPTDIPVTGQWTVTNPADPNSTKTKIGVFRNGSWFLDFDGNLAWNGCAVDACVDAFGLPTDTPVTGAWQ
jgi:hypothetical protein